MARLNIEDLEGRALMSAVVPVPPGVGQATVAFAAPVGSDKGSFAGDGFPINGERGATGAGPRPAQPNGIIAILIGL